MTGASLEGCFSSRPEFQNGRRLKAAFKNNVPSIPRKRYQTAIRLKTELQNVNSFQQRSRTVYQNGGFLEQHSGKRGRDVIASFKHHDDWLLCNNN